MNKKSFLIILTLCAAHAHADTYNFYFQKPVKQLPPSTKPNGPTMSFQEVPETKPPKAALKKRRRVVLDPEYDYSDIAPYQPRARAEKAAPPTSPSISPAAAQPQYPILPKPTPPPIASPKKETEVVH